LGSLHIWIDHSYFEVYLSNVRQDSSLLFWTRLIAVCFVTTGRLLHADDQPPSSDGYKTVPVTVGSKTIPVRVQEGGDPLKNVSSSSATGKYDPERLFSTTSSMANKTFSPPSDSISKTSSVFKSGDQNTFITKPYAFDPSTPSAPNLNTKVSFPTTSAYGRNATGFDKGYITSTADAGQNRPALFASSTVSPDLNHAAVLGGPDKPEVLATDPMANKQYLGPGAQHVPDNIAIKDNVVLSRMSGLPNRPLSIDEVRNLINHGFTPDTDVKSTEPSKPLNDPNYKPEPLRISPAQDQAAPTGDDDKNDPVPPPGTMAAPQAPENSEPLPQP
jgi:hypothetical protein